MTEQERIEQSRHYQRSERAAWTLVDVLRQSGQIQPSDAVRVFQGRPGMKHHGQDGAGRWFLVIQPRTFRGLHWHNDGPATVHALVIDSSTPTYSAQLEDARG